MKFRSKVLALGSVALFAVSVSGVQAGVDIGGTPIHAEYDVFSGTGFEADLYSFVYAGVGSELPDDPIFVPLNEGETLFVYFMRNIGDTGDVEGDVEVHAYVPAFGVFFVEDAGLVSVHVDLEDPVGGVVADDVDYRDVPGGGGPQGLDGGVTRASLQRKSLNIRPVSGNITRSAKRRRHQRVDDIERQLSINTGERKGRTGNWSRGGFLADGLDDYRTDDRVEGIMEGRSGDRVKFSGKVVRVQDDGMRAVQLVSFDSAALLAMQGTE